MDFFIDDKYFPDMGYSDPCAIYTKYCFGKFATFIHYPVSFTLEGMKSLITTLVALYDNNRGIGRKIFGDSRAIIVLKQSFVSNEGWNNLVDFDFNDYMYDYGKIHAHDMARKSLSRVIMLIVSHYLRVIMDNRDYPAIIWQYCSISYNNFYLGKKLIEDMVLICGYCTNETKRYWGKYQSCKFCYQSCVCFKCGKRGKGLRLGSFGLPVCSDH